MSTVLIFQNDNRRTIQPRVNLLEIFRRPTEL